MLLIFMFLFRGMPAWARWIGYFLPLINFVRITRALILKGVGFGVIIIDCLVINLA